MTKSDDLREFALEVRRRRELLGMTVEELAERSGLTPNYIGDIENNHRDPSLPTVVGLARGLGVEPWELFGDIPGVSAAAAEMGRLCELVPLDIRKAVFTIIRFFGE
jgi:transcriptional regulator with XRE-family HTH domain